MPVIGPMDRATTKLYEPSATPILYVAPCENMLGRVPLIPCFLQGNATPTIPHQLLHLKASVFQLRIADEAAVDGRRGSNVYEVNHGCGSLGAGGLAWGVCLCLRQRTGARRLSRMGRRLGGVNLKRPAAAARQLGAAMNETVTA